MRSFESRETNPAGEEVEQKQEIGKFQAGFEVMNYAPMITACTITTQVRGEAGKAGEMRAEAEKLLSKLSAKILAGAPEVEGVSLEDGESIYAYGHNPETMGPAHRFFLKGVIGQAETPQVHEARKQALEKATEQLKREAREMGLSVS